MRKIPDFKDLTGQRFGRLIVLEYSESIKNNKGNGTRIVWKCKCDCGNTSFVCGNDLKRGHTKSCGCYKREQIYKSLKKHGMRHDRIYHLWVDMKNRCFNPKYKRFHDWGGRGITVCDEWKNDFMSFYNHVSKLPHYNEKGYTLDRINNDGNYEPSNVRWATISDQNRNRRIIRYEVYREKLSFPEISQKYNVKYATVRARYLRGKPMITEKERREYESGITN